MSASQSISSPSNQPLTDVPKGQPRLRRSIAAGLVISNDEGRRWFKDKFGTELPESHALDFNVPLQLEEMMKYFTGAIWPHDYEADNKPAQIFPTFWSSPSTSLAPG